MSASRHNQQLRVGDGLCNLVRYLHGPSGETLS